MIENVVGYDRDYRSYISQIDKLTDETFLELINKILGTCSKYIDEDRMKKDFEKKMNEKNENKIFLANGNIEDKFVEGEPRINYLIKLCFAVNRTTKKDKVTESSEDKKLSEEKKLIQEHNKKEIEGIYKDLRSREYKKIKDGRSKQRKLSEESFIEYDIFEETEDREEYFYRIKHELLSQIIKELSNNPEKYKDYYYGFLEDDKGGNVFAINIPGYLGTFQFHIKEGREKEILYDLNCIESNHPFQELVKGDTEISKMYWIHSKDDVEDIELVLKKYNELKQKVKSCKEPLKCNKDFRLILQYCILLGKDPYHEFSQFQQEVIDYYIRKTDISLKNGMKQTFEKKKKYSNIMEVIKTTKKIYISSYGNIDTKVALETIIREAIKLGIIKDRDEIIVEEIEPGKIDVTIGGVFINTQKEDANINSKNRCLISVNEALKEESVSAYLARIGFDVPYDIIELANSINPSQEITFNPRSACLLANALSGEKIYELCEELKGCKQNLKSEFLSDEQIERYGLQTKYEERKRIIEEATTKIQYVEVLNKKIGICRNDKEFGYRAAFFAYANNADYCICISDCNNGIQCAIQSNPIKCNLPSELKKWVYNKKKKIFNKKNSKGEVGIEDILIERSRIIIGGKTKPNIFIKDTREDKSLSFQDEILKEILSEIEKGARREIINGLNGERVLFKANKTDMMKCDSEIVGNFKKEEKENEYK